MRTAIAIVLALASVTVADNHCGYPEQTQISPLMTPGPRLIWSIYETLSPEPPLTDWEAWSTGPLPLDRDYVVCCVTTSGYAIVVAPPAACTTEGDVCEYGFGVHRLHPVYPVAWDTDCDGDVDLMDFAALTKGGA